MRTTWKKYIEERYKAHVNITKIMEKMGVSLKEMNEKFFLVSNETDFVTKWKMETDSSLNPTMANFARDLNFEEFSLPDGKSLFYSFITSKPTTKTISRTVITTLVSNIAASKNVKCIDSSFRFLFVSIEATNSFSKSEINAFNALVPGTVTHFQISELIFNPLSHSSQPFIARKLSEKEIEEFVESQIGIKNMGIAIEPNYHKNLKNMQEDEAQRYRKKIRDKILFTLPKVYMNDVFIKWNGFFSGDVLYIVPKTGFPSYQLVSV